MKFICFILFGVILLGCSGRVQTNPLPEQHKVYLPNRDMYFKDVDELYLSRQFDIFISEYFRDDKKENSLWGIGLKRGYQQ